MDFCLYNVYIGNPFSVGWFDVSCLFWLCTSDMCYAVRTTAEWHHQLMDFCLYNVYIGNSILLCDCVCHLSCAECRILLIHNRTESRASVPCVFGCSVLRVF
eukprot:1100761_1